MTRPRWDALLSEMCGGSDDPDAGRLANEIEREVYLVEAGRCQLRDALKALTDAYCALLLMKAEDPSRFDGPETPYGKAKAILKATGAQ